MESTEFYWLLSDGLKLFAQEWSNGSQPQAVLCLVHGLGEHSGRYQHVAEYFSQHNIAMLGFDLRGHGKSEGLRGHIDSYDLYLDDIERMLQETRQRHPGVPVFLYGHSLGGTIALYYALKRKGGIDGIICSSPGIGLGYDPGIKLLIGKILYKLVPKFRLSNGLDRSGLSRVPKIMDLYNNDPLVHGMVSARLGLDLINAGKWVLRHAEELCLPVLIIQGSADRIVSVADVREFAQKAPPEYIDYKEWEGGYHELHDDIVKDEVFITMLGWVESRI